MDLAPTIYNNQIVFTTDQLAVLYGCSREQLDDNARMHDFIHGKHYFKLCGEELRLYKKINNKESLKYASKLCLWTKRGVTKHCALLGTDRAWEALERISFTRPMSLAEIVAYNAVQLVEQEKRMEAIEKELGKVKWHVDSNVICGKEWIVRTLELIRSNKPDIEYKSYRLLNERCRCNIHLRKQNIQKKTGNSVDFIDVIF